MDYFVSIENTMRDHWQIELMIESFKYHGLEDNLLIAIAEKEKDPTNGYFTYNLREHKRKYLHRNIGTERGYSPLNELYFLEKAIEEKRLNQPFVLLKPDMVLFQPIQVEMKAENFPEIIVCPDPGFTFDYANKHFPKFNESFNSQEDVLKQKWINPGELYIFNNIAESFIRRVILLCETYVFYQYYNLNFETAWEETVKLAWSIFISEISESVLIHGNYSLIQNMMDYGKNPIIHYKHGMPPEFNKKMFAYNPPNYHSIGDPFEILSKLQPNLGSKFISELASKNLEKRS